MIAERFLRGTVESARDQGNVGLESHAEIELARLCEQRRQRDEASEHYRRALEALERIRATLGYEEFQLSYFRSWQSSYDQIAKFFLRQGQVDQAFYTSERSRSRLLLALLGQGASNTRAWSGPGRDKLRSILRDYGGEVARQLAADRGASRTRGTTVGTRGSGLDETEAVDDPPRLREARARFLELQESERL